MSTYFPKAKGQNRPIFSSSPAHHKGSWFNFVLTKYTEMTYH